MPPPAVQRAMTRRFSDAPSDVRCAASIQLRDGSRAQCGRRRRRGSAGCWQHPAERSGSRYNYCVDSRIALETRRTGTCARCKGAGAFQVGLVNEATIQTMLIRLAPND